MSINGSNPSNVRPSDTQALMTAFWHESLKDDPLAWVMFAFPWGQENTPLAKYKGPRKWQLEELGRMRDHIAENKRLVSEGKDPKVFKLAISSGRGPGKSAFVAMVTWWFMSCIVGGSCVVSANTDSQLTSKTFGEIGKWHPLCLSGYWFDRIQKKITPQPWYAKKLKEFLKIDDAKYYAEGILWDENKADSFAGEHSDIGMLLIFDEASGIPKPIWTVSDGFFTEKTIYRFWLVFSNPRRNTGPFFECFHKDREFWNTRKIDSRSVEGLDRAVFDEIISKHGEDSDASKVEVKGEFPSQGDTQFISRGIVYEAQRRELDRMDDHAALVMGIDPARFGNDSTIIRFRRGRDARSIPPVELKGADNMKVANTAAHLIDEHNPDGVFCDSGAGAGIIDRLREMGYKVFEVGFGTESTEPQYADHRTELWARMREWLSGAMLDSDQKLFDDLVGPEYEFIGREDRIKLESKEKMKKRGLSSPDHADAIAVTFHAKLSRTDINVSRKRSAGKNRIAKGLDYKIFGGR